MAEDGANEAFGSTNSENVEGTMHNNRNAVHNATTATSDHVVTSPNPLSVRSRSTFEFDYSGEDWRMFPEISICTIRHLIHSSMSLS